jgi:hypothetical protein
MGMGTDPCKTLFLASEIDMKNAFHSYLFNIATLHSKTISTTCMDVVFQQSSRGPVMVVIIL